MPSGYALLPSFPDRGDIMVAGAVTPFGDNAVLADVRMGGRVSEHVAIDILGSVALHDDFDALLPGLQLAFATMYLADPLRLEASVGLTQSSLYASARLGVGHDFRWADGRWGARVAADAFGSLPSAGCGELVSCPDGPTRATFGGEAAVALGARVAGAEVALGPRVSVFSAGGAPVEVV
ncbi:MAG: hypothetical protein U1F43_02520 [Myxococcota bacterium]